MLWVYVYDANEDIMKCPKINVIFTSLVYFFGVAIWPIIINTWCWKTSASDKKLFAFSFIFGILYTLLATGDMIYSTFFHGASSQEPISCSTRGKVNLQWHVALTLSRLLPNGYSWFCFTVAPFFFYEPFYLGWAIGLWLMGTFSLPYVLETLGEAASIFCWLGFGLFVMFALEPLFLTLLEKKFPHVLIKMAFWCKGVIPNDNQKQVLNVSNSNIHSKNEVELESQNSQHSPRDKDVLEIATE